MGFTYIDSHTHIQRETEIWHEKGTGKGRGEESMRMKKEVPDTWSAPLTCDLPHVTTSLTFSFVLVFFFFWTKIKVDFKQNLKKTIRTGVYTILKNYKYTKSLFLNILRYNHLLIKTKTKTNFFFLILGWLGFFFF